MELLEFYFFIFKTEKLKCLFRPNEELEQCTKSEKLAAGSNKNKFNRNIICIFRFFVFLPI